METQTKNSNAATTVLEPRRTPPSQASPGAVHPHVLLVHWEIQTRAGQWQSACAVARALIAALPEEPIGWIYHSFALCQLGQLEEARTHLLAAARKFPSDWRVAYNLACLTGQRGDLAAAWNWLDESIRLGDAEIIRSLASSETRLKTLGEKAGARSLACN